MHAIKGLEPTDAYPSKYKYFTNKGKYSHTAGWGVNLLFQHVHDPHCATEGASVESLFGFAYVEKQLTYRKHRQLTNPERAMAGSDVTEQPRQPVSPNECFKSETGKTQPFRLFSVGQ